jgi:sterol desaturase/sphingolipid hydroxylase (fatty acid hydroxylase superfamily)
MSFSPVLIAVPLFALMIAIEAWYASRRDPDAYEAKDAWNNILIGFVSIFFGGLFGIAIGFVYAAAYEFAPFKFPADAWWSWVILFFVDDLAYYLFHRVSHESRVFWNFHVVHHSSQFYNLSVAVRQSWFGALAHWMFYAPIMLLGFAPWMFAVMHGFNLIYQFWIHTKFVKTLGPLEYVLNTPSHPFIMESITPTSIRTMLAFLSSGTECSALSSKKPKNRGTASSSRSTATTRSGSTRTRGPKCGRR